MLGHFINAAERINDIYWQQAYGDPKPLLDGISDPELKRLVEINFGPWDRIDANAAVCRRRGAQARGRTVLPGGHDQGGIRGLRGSGEDRPLLAGAPG